MYKCQYCGKEFLTKMGLSGHLSHCKSNPNHKVLRSYSDTNKNGHLTYVKKHPEKYELKEFTCICAKCGKEYVVKTTQEKFEKGKYSKFCSRSCANSRIRTQEIREKISNSMKNSEEFKNKNKIALEKRILRVENEKRKKENLPILTSISEISHNGYKLYTCKNCGKKFTYLDSKSRTYCCDKCREEWLTKNVKPKTGGYRKGSGQGKHGWYKGFHCDSSWELAFLIYHLDHNLFIKRCDKHFEYEYEGKKHSYYPDFETDEGIIEIKGYKNKQWVSKLEQVNNIKVLYKDDIKPYIDYVIEKYGWNFINLYDESKPIDKIKNRKFAWLHKDNETIFITYDKYDEYISNGWVLGRLKKTTN